MPEPFVGLSSCWRHPVDGICPAVPLSPAVLCYAVPDQPFTLTAAADSEPSGSFYAAATTEAGEVYVWLVRPKGDAAVDVQQVARLAVDPQHKQQEAIFAAALEHTAVGEHREARHGQHSSCKSTAPGVDSTIHKRPAAAAETLQR